MVAGELEYEPVEARGRDAWFDERPYQVERLRGQRARLAHRNEVFRPMQPDLAAAAANFLVCEHECR